jgi:hypothetical protein
MLAQVRSLQLTFHTQLSYKLQGVYNYPAQATGAGESEHADAPATKAQPLLAQCSTDFYKYAAHVAGLAMQSGVAAS